MDADMVQQSVGLATYLGEYGIWGILAVLATVIVHLYRQQSALSREIRDTVERYADESARGQAQLLAAIQRSDEVIERNTEALRRLTDR